MRSYAKEVLSVCQEHRSPARFVMADTDGSYANQHMSITEER
jgi:hypothetical protein